MTEFQYNSNRIVRPFAIGQTELADRVSPFGHKMLWFLQHGYNPHLYQLMFHTARNDDKLTRFRHLVAGRRGGKTKSASEEILYYALHPQQFHLDFHNEGSSDPLWIWEISKNYKEGRPAWLTFLKSLRDKELKRDKDYRLNKSERWVEFMNDSLIEFRSGEDEDSLRGAGLDFLWMDEAAFIPSADPYHIARPALSDKLGGVISTSTPKGKNWFYDEFWSMDSLLDDNQFRVEYWSIDNPYFPVQEWEYLQKTYHPMLFKQEYMAQWDAMSGIELHGDWLHYYRLGDLPRKADGTYDLIFYLGVDPALSLRETADQFAIALIGVTQDRSKVFLIDTFLDRVAFPDQTPLIQEWQTRPGMVPLLTGIESNAFQAALSQQLTRIPGFPTIIPQQTRQKKVERILSMAPLFQIGKVMIRETQKDFIDQWISYDSSIKNPRDDLLDAVEIALHTAGALVPPPQYNEVPTEYVPSSSVDEVAHRDLKDFRAGKRRENYDPELGDF